MEGFPGVDREGRRGVPQVVGTVRWESRSTALAQVLQAICLPPSARLG
jgi:hypothetical protein